MLLAKNINAKQKTPKTLLDRELDMFVHCRFNRMQDKSVTQKVPNSSATSVF
jgi:hypothetical protein